MKKIIFVSSLIFTILFAPSAVSAHILKTDGSIGVIFHLEPDHSPVVGEPAALSFDFTDKDNKLTTTNCECVVEIYKGEEKIYTEVLFSRQGQSTLNNQFFSFIFPSFGVYNVVVKGTPTVSSSFNSFRLEYDQRVDKGGSSDKNVSSSVTPINYVILICGGILLFVTLAILKSSKRRTNLKK